MGKRKETGSAKSQGTGIYNTRDAAAITRNTITTHHTVHPIARRIKITSSFHVIVPKRGSYPPLGEAQEGVCLLYPPNNNSLKQYPSLFVYLSIRFANPPSCAPIH